MPKGYTATKLSDQEKKAKGTVGEAEDGEGDLFVDDAAVEELPFATTVTTEKKSLQLRRAQLAKDRSELDQQLLLGEIETIRNILSRILLDQFPRIFFPYVLTRRALSVADRRRLHIGLVGSRRLDPSK